MKKEMNYSEAYLKLEELVKQLEEGDIPLEELTQKVKQANELIAVCDAKLRGIEKEVGDTTDDSAV
jgi:exodeoxyribonuclease VII small subunit